MWMAKNIFFPTHLVAVTPVETPLSSTTAAFSLDLNPFQVIKCYIKPIRIIIYATCDFAGSQKRLTHPHDPAQYAVPRGGGDHSAAKITSIKEILADFKHTF